MGTFPSRNNEHQERINRANYAQGKTSTGKGRKYPTRLSGVEKGSKRNSGWTYGWDWGGYGYPRSKNRGKKLRRPQVKSQRQKKKTKGGGRWFQQEIRTLAATTNETWNDGKIIIPRPHRSFAPGNQAETEQTLLSRPKKKKQPLWRGAEGGRTVDRKKPA